MRGLASTSLLVWLMLLLPVALTLPLAAKAQPVAGAGFTKPLPSPDLPDGVLTVKVVGKGMEDRKVGQPVTLLRSSGAGRPKALETVKTGDDGRARFEKLESGARYLVQVEAEGKNLLSEPFTGAESGGLRLLLTLSGAVDHSPASQPAVAEGHGGGGEAYRSGQGGGARITRAAQLERGQILVKVVKGSPPRPVVGVIVFAAGAPGGGHQRTDGEGKLLLTLSEAQLKSGSPTLTIVDNEMTYRSDPFKLPEEGGLEATFTVLDRTRDLGSLSIGAGSQLVLQPSEGAVNVIEVLHIHNASKALVDATSLRLALPRRARSAELPEGQKDVAALDEDKARVRLTTLLPPGSTVVRIYFELPYRGSDLDFSQQLPLPAAEMVASLRGQGTIFGPSVKGAEGEAGDQFVLAAVPAGGQLEFTVGGLPHRDRRETFISITVATLLLLWGLGAAWVGPKQAKKRRERQEALLQQLVQLQRSKRRGGATVERRKELLKELGEVWEESEREREPKTVQSEVTE